SQVTSFVVEDLNIKGMTKNRKLSRHINDVSWGNFIRILKYKRAPRKTQDFQLTLGFHSK
ncbi:hypothetical protein CBG25_02170, partial [Arsenophonus sp. ENCA]